MTILGQLPFTLFTEIAQTWVVQRDGMNTDIIYLYSTLTVHENHALLGSLNKQVDHPNRLSNKHPRDLRIYHLPCVEDGRHISEAKWHDRILEVPISSAKRNHPFMS